MNTRMIRASLAITSVLIASILIGGTMVFAGGLLYRWLADLTSPGVALGCLVTTALLLGGVVVLLGQLAFQHAVLPASFKRESSRSPDQLIATELVRFADGSPLKLLAASLGVGFALGLSPRLRRAVYQALTE